MKLHLSLSGKKLFPLYLGFYALFVFYFVSIMWNTKVLKSGHYESSALILTFVAIAVFFLGCFLLYTPWLRFFINNLSIDEQKFSYNGKIMPFFWKNILGIFLSIITIGIYSPWYIKKIYGYIVSNISFKDSNFDFKGTGKKLFVILLLTLFIPIVLLTVITTRIALKSLHHTQPNSLVIQIIMYFVLIPYMYFLIKWSINFIYKNFRITLDATAGASMVKLLVQIFLSIITCGIYMPVAYAQLFVYFGNRISIQSIESGDPAYQIQAKLSMKRAFLLVWGQTLLTIVTLGFYGPWALIKVYKFYLEGLNIEKALSKEVHQIEGV